MAFLDYLINYFIRFKVEDRPGVFASIGQVFKENGLSMENILQKKDEDSDKKNIVIVTHKIEEAFFIKALEKLKEKDFPEVRKWVVNNLDNDTSVLLRRIYDACYSALENNSVPAAVLVLAKYQYQSAFVADQEINMLACLTELMVECNFK